MCVDALDEDGFGLLGIREFSDCCLKEKERFDMS